jgi:hypothetical protein
MMYSRVPDVIPTPLCLSSNAESKCSHRRVPNESGITTSQKSQPTHGTWYNVQLDLVPGYISNKQTLLSS